MLSTYSYRRLSVSISFYTSTSIGHRMLIATKSKRHYTYPAKSKKLQLQLLFPASIIPTLHTIRPVVICSVPIPLQNPLICLIVKAAIAISDSEYDDVCVSNILLPPKQLCGINPLPYVQLQTKDEWNEGFEVLVP
jgi:hypothetical protein